MGPCTCLAIQALQLHPQPPQLQGLQHHTGQCRPPLRPRNPNLALRQRFLITPDQPHSHPKQLPSSDVTAPGLAAAQPGNILPHTRPQASPPAALQQGHAHSQQPLYAGARAAAPQQTRPGAYQARPQEQQHNPSATGARPAFPRAGPRQAADLEPRAGSGHIRGCPSDASAGSAKHSDKEAAAEHAGRPAQPSPAPVIDLTRCDTGQHAQQGQHAQHVAQSFSHGNRPPHSAGIQQGRRGAGVKHSANGGARLPATLPQQTAPQLCVLQHSQPASGHAPALPQRPTARRASASAPTAAAPHPAPAQALAQRSQSPARPQVVSAPARLPSRGTGVFSDAADDGSDDDFMPSRLLETITNSVSASGACNNTSAAPATEAPAAYPRGWVQSLTVRRINDVDMPMTISIPASDQGVHLIIQNLEQEWNPAQACR